MSAKKKTKKNKKTNSLKNHSQFFNVLSITLSSLIVVILILGIGLYRLEWNNALVRQVVKIIPYPGALVSGGQVIYLKDFYRRTEILRRYHELLSVTSKAPRYDLNAPEGQIYFQVVKKNLLNQMIEESIIKKEALKRGLEVTQSELDTQMEKTLEEADGVDKFREKINRVFAIDQATFKKDILLNQIYREKLYQSLLQEGAISAFGKDGFANWLKEASRQYRVLIPLKSYSWNYSNQTVDVKY